MSDYYFYDPEFYSMWLHQVQDGQRYMLSLIEKLESPQLKHFGIHLHKPLLMDIEYKDDLLEIIKKRQSEGVEIVFDFDRLNFEEDGT